MLQQTQVITVVPYFERFVAKFPTVESLASAPEEAVLLQWAGLGYYSRARNLHRGAQAIVARGRFPATREEWLEIPGVGPYTAGAISSIAFDHAEPILDGNVERVLSRVRRMGRARGDAAYKARLWRLAGEWVARAYEEELRPSQFNQALMELGATVCTPRAPKCLLCPLRAICKAAQAGDTESYPPRKKAKEWLQVREETHCYLDGQGRVLVERRLPGQWRAGLWDLPESEREGLVARGGRIVRLGEVETRHVVTRHKVTRLTHVWQVQGLRAAEASSADPAASASGSASSAAAVWVDPDDPSVPLGSAFKRTLQAIREQIP